MSNWLDELKPGDRVFVDPCRVYASVTPDRVARVTKTQIVCEGGGKYRRDDGSSVGTERWNALRLKPFSDPQCRVEWARRKADLSLKKVKVSDLTEEQCRDLVAYLAKLQPPAETKQ